MILTAQGRQPLWVWPGMQGVATSIDALSVGIGEVISCTVLGVLLVKIIESNAALRKIFVGE